VTLFDTTTNSPCSSVTPAHPASSSEGCPQIPGEQLATHYTQSNKDNVILLCTLDHFHAADESPHSFQTKAAKLIHKVIGLNSYLSRFEVLRAKLKSKKLEKQKPTPTEMEEYTKLSAQLHTSVLSVKHTTTDDIKAFEKDNHQTRCTYPDCRNPEYRQLHKKLDLAKKLSGLWDNYFNVILDYLLHGHVSLYLVLSAFSTHQSSNNLFPLARSIQWFLLSGTASYIGVTLSYSLGPTC